MKKCCGNRIGDIDTCLYENIKVRSIEEIEKEITKQKAIVIGINDLSKADAITANEKAKTLEWVLGIR